jgi:hypothetical protein
VQVALGDHQAVVRRDVLGQDSGLPGGGHRGGQQADEDVLAGDPAASRRRGLGRAGYGRGSGRADPMGFRPRSVGRPAAYIRCPDT